MCTVAGQNNRVMFQKSSVQVGMFLKITDVFAAQTHTGGITTMQVTAILQKRKCQFAYTILLTLHSVQSFTSPNKSWKIVTQVAIK